MSRRSNTPRPGRARTGILFVVASSVAAVAALALTQASDPDERWRSDAPPADPARLAAPDPALWRAAPLAVGRPAPGFSLVDARTGTPTTLNGFRGRPVVLLFGSYGCNVFCNELDGLIDLAGEYADGAAFVFVAIRDAGHPDPKTSPPVGAPRPGESAEETRLRQVREGAELLNLPFPTLIDADGEVERAYDAFPKRIVVVGADGRIVYDGGRGATGGPSAWDLAEIEDHLGALVRGQAAD